MYLDIPFEGSCDAILHLCTHSYSLPTLCEVHVLQSGVAFSLQSIAHNARSCTRVHRCMLLLESYD